MRHQAAPDSGWRGDGDNRLGKGIGGGDEAGDLGAAGSAAGEVSLDVHAGGALECLERIRRKQVGGVWRVILHGLSLTGERGAA